MAENRIRRALIAVYDKTGIVEFARALVDEFGIEIISTGGTAKHLKEAGIPVTLVEEVTGFPEMLDGRVKTLHPKIHAAILADRDNPDHMRQLAEQGIKPIDMVVVNLYPFEKTVADPNCKFEDAIEMIDIGGPCMLRAAAKNHRHVIVLSDSDMYEVKPKAWELPNFRLEMARHAIWTTSGYDASIAAYLSERTSSKRLPGMHTIRIIAPTELRYGENPHSFAAAYEQAQFYEGDYLAASKSFGPRVMGPPVVGAVMSYNNFFDADSALGLCAELTRAIAFLRSPSKPGVTKQFAGAVFIKHTNSCGAGIAADPTDAYRLAYLGDSNAAMGGILAVNFPVSPDIATMVMETYDRFGKAAGAGGFFVEVWVAPSFDDKAVEIIRTKKKWGENVRLLAVGDMSAAPSPDELEYKTVAGGMLVQSRDLIGLNEDQWKVVTKRKPTDFEMSDLRLAWLIAKHTKSNAISICKDGMLIGNGAGQMSRVMSCRIATWLAKENGHADKLQGSVAASDAFFPFRDGPEILLDAGVTAIIQPGGSKRDEETIAACDARGAAMSFTGTRHFKH